MATISPQSTRNEAVSSLSRAFGEKLLLSQAVREQHSGLEGHHTSRLPDAVLNAASINDVVEALHICAAHDMPLIAHGAGTSLEGNLSAVSGGLSLDLTGMNRILDVDPENMICRVEAGVTREQLNQELRHSGLFFPIDPGANATLGGMASTRASGTNAVRYGTMRDNVLSLEVVTADGRIIETGTRAAKSAAGYDLTGLFVGSEGTLGVITAVTLRLYGIPQCTMAGTVTFASVDDAVLTTIQAIQLGIPVARIELLDAAQIKACNAYSQLSLAEQPTLFLEFHGTEDGVSEQASLFGQIAKGNGGSELSVAVQVEDRNKLWKARHSAYFASKSLRPNARIWSTDVCVPIAKLADSIAATRADIERCGAQATIVGHVGDGNYHVLFVLDPNQPEEWEVAAGINERMVAHALTLGGTCTGEHSVGIGKRQCLVDERGADAISLMAAVKRAFDPQGLLNPGKIFL
ncbi:FAD-binding oxidoreductase [Sphingosinicella xenopeptidilytica]|uniref:D-lactate dehydrogenase (cytochrome) n=1 Tax=Sphingosinicella xenopeptidilytica TaxID=364098 RepID=A0ABW3C2T1_SPHXN